VAIGYGAMVWFARGERPSQEAMKKMVSGVAVHLRDRLLGLGKKRPDRGTLRERIAEALRDLPGQLSPDAQIDVQAEADEPAAAQTDLSRPEPKRFLRRRRKSHPEGVEG
jgi:hypothetical protein